MANTIYAPKDKFNLMGLYFPMGSSTYEIMAQMRKALIEERIMSIPYSQIRNAQQEIKEARQKTDGSTPEFAQDLNKLVFLDRTVRAILIAKGDFQGDSNVEGIVLAVDLGTNPWPLYQNHFGYETIDDKVTVDGAREYLQGHQQELKARGITALNVSQSSFFYFEDWQLKSNFGDGNGGISLEDLIPYVVDTNGFIGLEQASKPNERSYRERAVPFVSYRQKGAKSLLDKVIRKLCQRDSFADEGDVIADWGGHRICTATEEEAITWSKVFRDWVGLDRFQVTNVHTDDYYTRPKRTGFRAYNIAVRVASQRYGPVTREIQIYDLMPHFNSQIDESHPAFHRKFKRKEEESMRRRRAILESFEYRDVLELMFSDEGIEVPVPK